jgi:hypothetical protein
MAEYMEACALIARNGADIHNGSKELREHADMVTAIASYLSSAVETDWKHRAEEAERILQDNMALANRTTRRTMDERNGIIRKLRERYSAIEIADMVGLTRQRVHQILNEEPVEGSVHGSPAERPAHPDPTGTTREPPHCPTCACGAPYTYQWPWQRGDAPAAETRDDDASLRRECVDLAAEQCVSVAGCTGWPLSALLAFKLLCQRSAVKASAPTTCDTKCFGWPRCECGRRMP